MTVQCRCEGQVVESGAWACPGPTVSGDRAASGTWMTHVASGSFALSRCRFAHLHPSWAEQTLHFGLPETACDRRQFASPTFHWLVLAPGRECAHERARSLEFHLHATPVSARQARDH